MPCIYLGYLCMASLRNAVQWRFLVNDVGADMFHLTQADHTLTLKSQNTSWCRLKLLDDFGEVIPLIPVCFLLFSVIRWKTHVQLRSSFLCHYLALQFLSMSIGISISQMFKNNKQIKESHYLPKCINVNT